MTKFVIVLLLTVGLVMFLLVSTLDQPTQYPKIASDNYTAAYSTDSNSNSPTPTITIMPTQVSKFATPAANPETNSLVLFKTSMGDVKLEIFTKTLPITGANFVKLVSSKFYDGVIFHRIIDGFMIQGGDPTGTGMGGPGYTIKDELFATNKNDRGTISMANSGPNTGGSQFFINLVNNNFLDTKHPVFGKVVAGMDVVDKIAKVKTDYNDRPETDVKIISATIVEK